MDETRELGGVTRSQNVVYVVPHDWASIAYFLGPLVERVDEAVKDVQLIVLAADSESAAAIAAGAVRLIGGRPIGILAATSLARSKRLLKLLPPQIVVGTPSTLLDLVKGSLLKLTGVRAVAFAWADDLLSEAGVEETMGTLLAELPKDAARTIATTEMTPAVEGLVERHARRARRVTSSATTDTTPLSIEYITTAESARPVALRRMLDALDLDNASIFVRNEDARDAVASLLRSLGYHGESAPVRISHGGGSPATVILYDLPASREELSEAIGASAKRVIAMVQPRQLTSLRVLAGGGRVRSIVLPDVGARVRGRDEILRAQLRAVLERGVGRTVLAIEPLLEEFDGVEIAAAALELLETERAAPRASQASPVEAAPSGGMTRLFLSVGSRDGLRTGEVVATIGNDAGVASSEIGKIDIRESHTIVEVGTSSFQQVIDRLSGRTMAGRRLTVRQDQDAGERPAAGPRSRERSAGFAGKREGAPRRDGPPSRGGPRGAGGFGGGRPARGEGFSGGERRPPRGDGPPRSRPAADRPRRPRPGADE